MSKEKLFVCSGLLLLLLGGFVRTTIPAPAQIFLAGNAADIVEDAADLAGADSAAPSFLVLSDIHLHDGEDQSPGVTKNSDSGQDLWDSAEKKIRAVLAGRETGTTAGRPESINRPKFILYLGDLPWHAKDSDRVQIAEAMDDAGKVLKDLRLLAEGAHIPLLFVPGNNDSEEGDYAPFSASLFRKDPHTGKPWPLIDGARATRNGRGHSATAYPAAAYPRLEDTTAWALGCYSADPLGPRKGPLVLVLNSNIFTARYGRMAGKTKQAADAGRALQWLDARLRSAAASHRRVLIAMHVPPGKDGYLTPAADRETCTGKFKDLWDPSLLLPSPVTQQLLSAQDIFLDLVDAWRHSILGILSSHTHMDGIRLLKNRAGDSVSTFLISVPGIAPGHGNNPAFKLIRYDPANFQLNDFTTFYENFFPDRTVKSWGDRSFSFRQVFHDEKGAAVSPSPNSGVMAAGGSMLERLRSLSVDSLRSGVNSIYTVYNGDGYGKGNCVDTTLYVYYQTP